ncbi:MAG: hypothetical protein SH859_08125 [Hyphomicrobium aestuarii]|jgi:hypothetical protein|nr:hypothetical protein [Hyphomicrobium aestuarii]
MSLFAGMSQDESRDALAIILDAWDEGLESGIAPERLAYAAMFTALTDLVGIYGEDAVSKLIQGLEQRVRDGEFSLRDSRVQ